MANIYDLVTAPILATEWNERIRERQPFYGESIFPAVKQLSNEFDIIKGGVQTPKVLNLSAYDAKAIPVEREGFEKIHTEIPFFKNFKSIQEKERREIQNVAASAGKEQILSILLNNVYNDEFNLINMAHSTLEYMRMMALTEGTISFSNNGTAVAIDYGLGADQKITKDSGKWTATTTADPIADIISWQEKIATKTGVTPNTVLMNTATFAAMRKTDAVKNAVYVFGNGKVTPSAGAVKQLVLDETGCELIIYDKGVTINKTFTKFVEDGKVVLYDRNNVGKTVFSVTPEESDLMTGTDASVAVVDTGITITTTKETDPVNVKTKVSMVALPSLEGADYIIQAKVY